MRLIGRRRLGAAILALGAAVAVGACGSSSSSSTTGSVKTTPVAGQPGKGKPAVTIGSKNFTEELILGQLYAQALRAKGYKVNLKENVGSTELTDKALTSGQIDMYPEYTGTILSVVAHQTKPPSSPQDAYTKAQAFESSRGFTLLGKTPFVDSDALATLPAYATAHKLKSIADLKPLGKGLTLIAAPEFATRQEGLVGLKQAYGVNPTFKPLTIGLTYTALDGKKADVADVFTTDAQLVGGKYTLLADPKFVFGYQNVAPVVGKKVLTREGPAFRQTIDAVSAKLTTPAMQSMNAAVGLSHQTAAAVAQKFLAANGLG
ncbi:MAG: glycine betaine ABC transporter substrate-binding protein [Solirubrobacteraceae bacterium]